MSAQPQLKTTARAQRSVVSVCWRLAAPDVTAKHVIVALWFEEAVLCSDQLLYVAPGRDGWIDSLMDCTN